jgi:hypothetical protein
MISLQEQVNLAIPSSLAAGMGAVYMRERLTNIMSENDTLSDFVNTDSNIGKHLKRGVGWLRDKLADDDSEEIKRKAQRSTIKGLRKANDDGKIPFTPSRSESQSQSKLTRNLSDVRNKDNLQKAQSHADKLRRLKGDTDSGDKQANLQKAAKQRISAEDARAKQANTSISDKQEKSNNWRKPAAIGAGVAGTGGLAYALSKRNKNNNQQ